MTLVDKLVSLMDRYMVESASGSGLPGRSTNGIPNQIDEQSAKFYGSILLCDISKRVVIPTVEEWIGINLLERDDELRRMK